MSIVTFALRPLAMLLQACLPDKPASFAARSWLSPSVCRLASIAFVFSIARYLSPSECETEATDVTITHEHFIVNLKDYTWEIQGRL